MQTKAESVESLRSVSPIDGRYGNQVGELSQHFSEHALMEQRVQVEAKWALQLVHENCGCAAGIAGDGVVSTLRELAEGVSEEQTLEIKREETLLNHDVKAVEYFVKRHVKAANPSVSDGALEAIHFGCTSEDINNLAHALAARRALDMTVLPAMDGLIESIASLSESLASVPMLSRTHGQAASPTTLGRELAVFALRLKRQRESLANIHLLGKMAGAVGNYSAHRIAEPSIDWTDVAERFVNSLGLEHNPLVTQIEPHDAHAEIFDAIERFNSVLLDFATDAWGYISLGYFRQKLSENEVGSSTMPHKVNPIDFENCEGNLGLANSLLQHLGRKLQVSRFQRDLSDSTAIRNIGVAFSHTLLAIKSAKRGVSKLEADDEAAIADLENHWELLGEAVQTVLRHAHVSEPYERIKQATRGNTLGKEEYMQMLDELPLSEHDRERLQVLSPRAYLGYSVQQALDVRERMNEIELAYSGHRR